MSQISLLTITLFLAGFSCSLSKNDSKLNNKNQEKSTDQTINKMKDYYPFKISDNTGLFAIIAETESLELFPKYADFFEKHGYSGNGYCWEGHIIQIMETLNPELLKHYEFDSEAGSFFSYADTKENQIKIVELLSPIFEDLSKLEEYVKKADRSRIDD